MPVSGGTHGERNLPVSVIPDVPAQFFFFPIKFFHFTLADVSVSFRPEPGGMQGQPLLLKTEGTQFFPGGEPGIVKTGLSKGRGKWQPGQYDYQNVPVHGYTYPSDSAGGRGFKPGPLKIIQSALAPC